MMLKDKESKNKREEDWKIIRKNNSLNLLFHKKKILLWLPENHQPSKSNNKEKKRNFNFKHKNKDQNKPKRSHSFNTKRNNSKKNYKRKDKNKDQLNNSNKQSKEECSSCKVRQLSKLMLSKTYKRENKERFQIDKTRS